MDRGTNENVTVDCVNIARLRWIETQRLPLPFCHWTDQCLTADLTNVLCGLSKNVKGFTQAWHTYKLQKLHAPSQK